MAILKNTTTSVKLHASPNRKINCGSARKTINHHISIRETGRKTANRHVHPERNRGTASIYVHSPLLQHWSNPPRPSNVQQHQNLRLISSHKRSRPVRPALRLLHNDEKAKHRLRDNDREGHRLDVRHKGRLTYAEHGNNRSSI